MTQRQAGVAGAQRGTQRGLTPKGSPKGLSTSLQDDDLAGYGGPGAIETIEINAGFQRNGNSASGEWQMAKGERLNESARSVKDL